jgi:hypothetical protein
MNRKLIIIFVIVIAIVIGLSILLSSYLFSKDIAFTNMSIPSNTSVNQTLIVSNTIKNYGNSATGGFVVAFFLTPEKNTQNKIFIGKRTVDNLLPHELSAENTTLKIPANVTPGTYYIFGYVDYTTNVTESNEKGRGEKNNYIFSADKITVS